MLALVIMDKKLIHLTICIMKNTYTHLAAQAGWVANRVILFRCKYYGSIRYETSCRHRNPAG